jgi:hypothetical protein
MFEITGDDIQVLTDEDLRSLIGLLCESELKAKGFSAAFVTWGGNQNAADGGLDVRVALPSEKKIEGFVPRPATGFQAKSSDMSPSDIIAEMRPKNILRPVIRDLAHRSGGYIIVSSRSSATGSSLERRLSAMRQAVEDLPTAATLALDFYDSGRLASWVRDHPGLIAWVRKRIGKSIPGWQPYGAWAYDPDGLSGEYLLDDRLRVISDVTGRDRQLTAVESIQRIRELLQSPRSIVRLVGLSGVGKTRFVQVLFDSRVGEQSLDSSLACYTDLADGPDPPPMAVASDLIAGRRRAILVIDNCPPSLHRRLSELCRSAKSRSA